MGWASTSSIKDTATRMALQKFADKLDQDKAQTWAGLTLTNLTQGSVIFSGAGGLISQDNSNLFWDDTNNRLGIGTATPTQALDVAGKIAAGSFSSPIDVTATREHGLEIHYSGNNYNATGIRSRASAVTTDTAAQFQGGLFQAANNDDVNVGVLNGLVAEAIGKATTNAATISTMRGALIGAEWSAKDTITDLRTLHVRTHTRDAATEGYFSNSGYGIYIENEAVGGNGQALTAGIYFKGTNLSAGNKAFTHGIDFSGATFGTAEIKLSNGETIDNLVDGVVKLSGGGLWIDGTTGDTPTSGAGTRLMWIPAKGAFRAGVVTGTEWDVGNVGIASIAMAYNTTASGTASVAMGDGTTASGAASVTMGRDTTAGGNYSVAAGRNMQLTSAADNTFAFGYSASAISIVQPDTFFLYATAFQMCNATTGVAATDGLKMYLSGSDLYFNNQDGDIYFVASGLNIDFGSSALLTAGALGAGAITGTDLFIDTDLIYTDSTNNRVGIGRVPAAQALEVAGNIRAIGGSISADLGLFAVDVLISGKYTWAANQGDYIQNDAAGKIQIFTANAERFEIDSAEATFTVPIATNGTVTAGGAITDGAASSFTSGTTIGTLTLADGSITDSGTIIDFGSDALTTTGFVGFGAAASATKNLYIYDNNIGALSASNWQGLNLYLRQNNTWAASRIIKGLAFQVISAPTDSQANRKAYGFEGKVEHVSAQPMGALWGGNVVAQLARVAGSGTVSNVYGLESEVTFYSTTTGTITTAYGLKTSVSAGTNGAITTGYGLHIAAPVGTIGTYYSIYSAGGDNYLAGDLAIGTGAAPTAALDVTGDIKTTGFLELTQKAGTTTDGDLWNDSTQEALQTFVSGIEQTLVGVIFTQTADQTIANTTTETTLFGTGVGTLTLPANFWVVGKTIRVEIHGDFADTGNPTAQIRVKLDAVELSDSTAITLSGLGGTEEWETEVVITCRSVGGSGTVETIVDWEYETTTGSSAIERLDIGGTLQTVDTTQSDTLDITFAWGTAHADNILISEIAFVEILN